MHFVYNLSIHLYVVVIWIAHFFHKKAKLWILGRRNWKQRYAVDFQKHSSVLWVHVASLGEFEQGRPIIEQFKQFYPDWQIVLSFFSASGYEVRKHYPHADFVCYLPADTPGNAAAFLDIIRPDCAIFIKYEFWANYLFTLKKRGVPVLLVAALFRENQLFFHPLGGFWRKMLSCFRHIFVQNKASAALLQHIGVQQISIGGDTRVDRVLRLAEEAKENEIVADFTANDETKKQRIIIAGSTWPVDEKMWIEVLQKPDFQDYKIVFAPHEPQHAAQLYSNAAPLGVCVRYSEYTHEKRKAARVLIIDNVGLLNTLYRYGTLAYIGGGFGRGIHNTLEPAAWGLPILFGPKYTKFEEAVQFVARGGAFVAEQTTDVEVILKKLENETLRKNSAAAVRQYLEENKGATQQVLQYLSTLLAHNA
jgi:3-deoxy-D-manno-octulosonic-acid transferase